MKIRAITKILIFVNRKGSFTSVSYTSISSGRTVHGRLCLDRKLTAGRLSLTVGQKWPGILANISDLGQAPNRNFIFHNKIPKAGSTTFYNLLVPLSSMNNFDLIHLVPCFDKDDPQPLQDEGYFSKQRPGWDLSQCTHSLQVCIQNSR